MQCPPTRSGRPVWFLLLEDERGLLRATSFERIYDRCGWLLHHRGALLVEGKVEQNSRRGFSFLVQRVGDLSEALAEAAVPSPRTNSSSGTMLRAGRRRRVG